MTCPVVTPALKLPIVGSRVYGWTPFSGKRVSTYTYMSGLPWSSTGRLVDEVDGSRDDPARGPATPSGGGRVRRRERPAAGRRGGVLHRRPTGPRPGVDGQLLRPVPVADVDLRPLLEGLGGREGQDLRPGRGRHGPAAGRQVARCLGGHRDLLFLG